MAGVAARDMRAFAQLVERHQERIRALAYRFTRRWDVADDVTQDAFLRLFRSAPTYKPQAAFSTWLYRIVANLCLDAARRPPAMRVREHDDAPATDPGADARLSSQEMCRAVQHEVANLPERQRMVLLLHRFEGLGHADIAAVTGWSESAVESLLVRAYARLRERLRDWADE
jgi:RNA polymerase sigma-70 factor, ECF subfamily